VAACVEPAGGGKERCLAGRWWPEWPLPAAGEEIVVLRLELRRKRERRNRSQY